jgi:hypothetical protein
LPGESREVNAGTASDVMAGKMVLLAEMAAEKSLRMREEFFGPYAMHRSRRVSRLREVDVPAVFSAS